MKKFPFLFNDIGGKIIEERIKSILLRSEMFHRFALKTYEIYNEVKNKFNNIGKK
ncbi:hypothetical protein PFMC_01237 [Plasmodium falciparum CAMP/Malaysia]|uniref:Uncharacterized protein n=3 Tax=Plasmodium falciparum TaxID=5833 RepID=A0A024XBN3_PLAFC|nr:hypothetical protein PFMC_01237 [Plasmodium falciparum CAMP/Malaysia]